MTNHKWSKEQHTKFSATMKAKNRGKKSREPNYVPEVAAPRERAVQVPAMVIEVKAGSEATFVVGGARVTVRAIK